MAYKLVKGVNDLASANPELAAQWHPTKNGDLRPEDVFVSSNKKYWWLYHYVSPDQKTQFDFEWEASPNNRNKKDGVSCPFVGRGGRTQLYVGFNDLKTMFPEIAAQWHPTKNGSLSPEDVLAQSGSNVWWLLPFDDPKTYKHFDFEWQATIQNRTMRGHGCPYLSNMAVWEGYNDLKTTFPELAAQWHPTKNGELKPSEVVYGSNQKVWWLLPYNDLTTGKHFDFEWQSTIVDRTGSKKLGCPYLSNAAVWKGYNDLATSFPEIAALWHPTKNKHTKNKVGVIVDTPDKVSFGSGQKVWWLGECGHEWQQEINRQVKTKNCPICRITNQISTNHNGNKDATSNKQSGVRYGSTIYKGINDFATIHPELMSEWNYMRNDIAPDEIPAGCHKKVWWKCEKGHEWEASINQRHRLNTKCPYCSGIKVWEGYNDLATTHPYLLEEWDFDKNGKLLPTMVSRASEKKVWWKCEKGHSWYAYIKPRTIGVGCPICLSEKHTSFPEYAIFYYISKVDDSVIHSYKDLGFEIDVYIPNRKIGIEYDGYFYHQNHQKKDLDKNRKCEEHGITLYRFRENNLGVLNDSSVDIVADEKLLGKNIFELIKRIYACELDIDIDRDLSEINRLREFTEKEDSLETLFPELANEWHPIKNGKLTAAHVKKKSGQKVWWLGKCGHEWQAIISSRVNGNGCPFCSNKLVLVGFNDLLTLFPEISAEWHPTKNEQLTPSSTLSGSQKKVWWLGKCGHEWQAIVQQRTRLGTGCPYCSNKRTLAGFNDLATTNPELLDEWDFDKNQSISPYEIQAGTEKKVWWKCKKCGNSWKSLISSRSTKGCPKCGVELSNSSKYKKVINLDTGKVFGSIKEAAEFYSLGPNHNIGLVCKGTRKKAGGFRWAFLNE